MLAILKSLNLKESFYYTSSMTDCELSAYIRKQLNDTGIPLECTGVGSVDELQSKLKDLEQKVANLFMDNVALTTKLKASREVERQQQVEIESLKERLVQTLRAEVMHFYVCMELNCVHLVVINYHHIGSPFSQGWYQ